ncbi:MAG: hypothetical protein LV481_09015 [Methylacidiphilales bacterium]|nr:hypothetical protein [Candidatus Methylacidiphilales bacterium]
MEAFKEFFRLDHILRNCIGGVAFYLIIYRETQPEFDVSDYLLHASISWVNLVGIVIAVSLTGILLHAMERNSIAIIAENLRSWVISEKILLKWIFPEKARKESIWRFQQQGKNEIWLRLTSWGASAHCLYTVSMAVFAATLCLFYDDPSNYSFCGILYYLPIEVIFLLLGFLSDLRKALMESDLKATQESNTPC